MNLPSGEISCPDRPFRLSDSESVGVCLVCACVGRESLRARTETARASFFKRAPPADVQLYQTNDVNVWSDSSKDHSGDQFNAPPITRWANEGRERITAGSRYRLAFLYKQ